MGISISSYMGAYIKITKNKFDTIVSKSVCVNSGCTSYNKSVDSKFCPNCGKEIQVVKFNEHVEFSLWDFVEKYDLGDDNFYIPECYDIIIPQFEGENMYEEGELNIIENIPHQNDLFLDPKWIALIKAFEGEGVPFELCYGMVSYWS
jgi:hypothetical protein